MADDFIVSEKRERFYAITDKTIIDKEGGESIEESFIPIKQTADSLLISGVKRIEVKIEDENIQKTGLVCTGCYKDTDTVIWGIHKNK